LILAGKFPSGEFPWKLLPWIETSTSLTLHYIPLAELHQLSYYLYKAVVSLKSYAMEYLGWKISRWRSFLLITLPKANFSS
jgi:hypothetical protein